MVENVSNSSPEAIALTESFENNDNISTDEVACDNVEINFGMNYY